MASDYTALHGPIFAGLHPIATIVYCHCSFTEFFYDNLVLQSYFLLLYISIPTSIALGEVESVAIQTSNVF